MDGTSIRYEDAWEVVHPGEPGHTFSPHNPLVGAGEMPLERGRRIDYIIVRCGIQGPTLDVVVCSLAFDQPADSVWASDYFGLVADLQLPGDRLDRGSEPPWPLIAAGKLDNRPLTALWTCEDASMADPSSADRSSSASRLRVVTLNRLFHKP